MKPRISLTIDKNLLEKLDQEVDGINVKSRSEAVEKILHEKLSAKNVAVILAGGNPNNLRIGKTYRPLVEINNETLIEYLIEQCRKINFDKILIVAQAPLISEIFKVIGNGSNLGVEVKYLEEKEEMGSAKTLELAKDYLKSTFLLMPCDHFFDFDLEELLHFHKREKSIATEGVYANIDQKFRGNPMVLGASIVQMHGPKIIDYKLNPQKPKTNLNGTLICFVEPEVFNHIPPGKNEWWLQKDVFPFLSKHGKMSGFLVSGNWVNVHSQKDVDIVREIRKNTTE